MEPQFTVDKEAGVGYVKFQEGQSVSQRWVTEHVLFDLGENGQVIGIEFMNIENGEIIP